MAKDDGGVGKVTQMPRQKAARCRTGYRRLLGLADKRTLSLKNSFVGDFQEEEDLGLQCILVSKYPATTIEILKNLLVMPVLFFCVLSLFLSLLYVCNFVTSEMVQCFFML